MSQQQTITRLKRALSLAKQALKDPTLRGHTRRVIETRRDNLEEEIAYLAGQAKGVACIR